MTPKWVVFDSDGNLIEETAFASELGNIISRHYALVDDTTRLNARIGIPPADEPFVYVTRREG